MAKAYPGIDYEVKRPGRDRFTVKLSTKYYCGHTLTEAATASRESAAKREANSLLDNTINRHKIKCKKKIEEFLEAKK